MSSQAMQVGISTAKSNLGQTLSAPFGLEYSNAFNRKRAHTSYRLHGPRLQCLIAKAMTCRPNFFNSEG
eukprot:6206104-Pleurochrysis_carterae.AAC.3